MVLALDRERLHQTATGVARSIEIRVNPKLLPEPL
jgi:hypothetical protein